MIAADLEEAERPSLTHDTKDIAGTPDIFATILSKIDAASVFVADVTPVGITDGGKALANPNVLIELGYAHKSIGTQGVVLVWNTHFDGATPERLPFDMRGRRAPLGYALEPGADRKKLAAVRSQLTGQLASRIGACLDAASNDTPQPAPWAQAAENAPEIWFTPNSVLTVTNPESGSTQIYLRPSLGRGYARIIPDRWNAVPDSLDRLHEITGTPALVGDTKGLDSGASRGGMAAYRPNHTSDRPMDVGAITQWFSSTGEFWGVANEFFYEDDDGARNLATTYIVKHWCYFLSRNGHLVQTLGGQFPFHVKLGVTNLDDTWWPVETVFPGESRFAAVEAQFEFAGILESVENSAVFRFVEVAFGRLASAYGKKPWSIERISAVAAGAR